MFTRENLSTKIKPRRRCSSCRATDSWKPPSMCACLQLAWQNPIFFYVSVFFFLSSQTDEVTKESRTPTHTICLYLQEGNTSGGPLSSRRHEQLLHGSAQRRHQPLHHQVVKCWKPWSCWKLKQKSNSDSGLLTLKQSGFPSCRDLAAAVDRMQEYHFHEMIYVVRQQSTLRISIEVWELITCVSSG